AAPAGGRGRRHRAGAPVARGVRAPPGRLRPGRQRHAAARDHPPAARVRESRVSTADHPAAPAPAAWRAALGNRLVIAGLAVIAVFVGLYAGYYGRWVDAVLMRMTDVVLALPALLLAIALAGLMNGKVVMGWPVEIKLERGLFSVCLVIGIVSWTGIARVVRG